MFSFFIHCLCSGVDLVDQMLNIPYCRIIIPSASADASADMSADKSTDSLDQGSLISYHI